METISSEPALRSKRQKTARLTDSKGCETLGIGSRKSRENARIISKLVDMGFGNDASEAAAVATGYHSFEAALEVMMSQSSNVGAGQREPKKRGKAETDGSVRISERKCRPSSVHVEDTKAEIENPKKLHPPMQNSAQHIPQNAKDLDEKESAASNTRHWRIDLDGVGTDSLDIPTEKIEEFSTNFLACLNDWISSQLNLPEKEKIALKVKSWKDVQHFLDPQWRKKHLTKRQSMQIRAGFDGGGSARFNPWKGLRLSGFGITSHLRGLKFCIEAMPTLRTATARIFGTSERNAIPSLPPSLILKPPSLSRGSGLNAHVDRGSLEDMYRACTVMLHGGHVGFGQWTKKFGVQVLAHVQGARIKNPGGHTHGFANFDIRRYLCLLTMFHPECPHPAVSTPKMTKKGKTTKNKRGGDSRQASKALNDPESISTPEVPKGIQKSLLDVNAKLILSSRQKAFSQQFSNDPGGPVFVPFFDPGVITAINAALYLLDHPSLAIGMKASDAVEQFSKIAHSNLEGKKELEKVGISSKSLKAAAQWLGAVASSGRLTYLLPTSQSRHIAARRDETGAFSPVKDVKICPKKLESKAYLAIWPSGTPHYVAPSGPNERITLVTNMHLRDSITQHHANEMDRVLDRLDLLLQDRHQELRANERLMRPFHGGIVHTHTETEIDIFPHFRKIYVESANGLRNLVESWNNQ